MANDALKYKNMTRVDFQVSAGVTLKKIEEFIDAFRVEFKEMSEKVERHDDEIKELKLRAKLRSEDSKSRRGIWAAVGTAVVLSAGNAVVGMITILPALLKLINGG